MHFFFFQSACVFVFFLYLQERHPLFFFSPHSLLFCAAVITQYCFKKKHFFFSAFRCSLLCIVALSSVVRAFVLSFFFSSLYHRQFASGWKRRIGAFSPFFSVVADFLAFFFFVLYCLYNGYVQRVTKQKQGSVLAVICTCIYIYIYIYLCFLFSCQVSCCCVDSVLFVFRLLICWSFLLSFFFCFLVQLCCMCVCVCLFLLHCCGALSIDFFVLPFLFMQKLSKKKKKDRCRLFRLLFALGPLC